VGVLSTYKESAKSFFLFMTNLRIGEWYGRLQNGLLEVFRRFYQFFVGRAVELAEKRFTVQDFGLDLTPETSLRRSFTRCLKEVAEEGTERKFTTLIELERAFYNHGKKHEENTPGRKDERAFRRHMQLFFDVWK